MCILFPATPPAKADSKNRGGMQNKMLAMQNNPNKFKIDLKNACCKDPLCCCVGALGTYPGCGLSACWARKSILEKKMNGISDFICCQGYIPKCACLDPVKCFPGSPVGLCLEGCCCAVLSISIARMHIMELESIQPDPVDYQIIQCSNFLQMLSCVCNIIAMFVAELREVAACIDLIADLFTCSVAGCMIAQVNAQLKTGGAPPALEEIVGAPPVAIEEMER